MPGWLFDYKCTITFSNFNTANRFMPCSLANIRVIKPSITKPFASVTIGLVIVLYSRISRCLKYHKEDIDIYMNYWRYLENKKSNYLC